MREKGKVDRPQARSKVGFDRGVPGEWYGSESGGSGIRNWVLGIRVLPLQGKVSLRMEDFYQPAALLGQGEPPTDREKHAVYGSQIGLNP